MIPVIISSKAGKQKQEDRIRAYLGPDFNYLVTRCKEDVARLSLEQALKGEKLFLLVSGDTSIDEAVNSIMKNAPKPVDTAIGIVRKGTAENTAANMGMSDLYESCRLYRLIADGKLSLEEHVRDVDLVKVSFDDNKTLYTASSFNIGMISQVCHGVENDNSALFESFFRRNQMKITAYTLKAAKAALTYQPFKAELAYTLADGKKESFVLEKLLDINMINGKKHAALPDWNPHGSPYDGRMEFMGFRNPNIFSIMRFVAKMIMSRHYSHLSTLKKSDGYNAHGIHFEDNVKNVEIRILEKGHKGDLYVELGGTTWHIEKPHSLIRAEVVPGAMKFIYKP